MRVCLSCKLISSLGSELPEPRAPQLHNTASDTHSQCTRGPETDSGQAYVLLRVRLKATYSKGHCVVFVSAFWARDTCLTRIRNASVWLRHNCTHTCYSLYFKLASTCIIWAFGGTSRGWQTIKVGTAEGIRHFMSIMSAGRLPIVALQDFNTPLLETEM